MVTAYSAFANRGMRVNLMFVTAITDANGNVLAEFSPRHTEVISEEAYWRILSMLLNVVDSGTGNRIRRPPYNITAQTKRQDLGFDQLQLRRMVHGIHSRPGGLRHG